MKLTFDSDVHTEFVKAAKHIRVKTRKKEEGKKFISDQTTIYRGEGETAVCVCDVKKNTLLDRMNTRSQRLIVKFFF